MKTLTPEQKLQRVARAFRLYRHCLDRSTYSANGGGEWWQFDPSRERWTKRAIILRAYIEHLTAPVQVQIPEWATLNNEELSVLREFQYRRLSSDVLDRAVGPRRAALEMLRWRGHIQHTPTWTHYYLTSQGADALAFYALAEGE